MSRQIRRDRLLRRRAAARVEVQVVLVDVDDFHARPTAAERERIAGFDGLCEIDHALPVAMVELCRSNEREEPRWIDLVHASLELDVDVVAELFNDFGYAA